MNGPKTSVKPRSGSATRSTVLSARRSAHSFGACSPTVMWRTVITVNAMAIDAIGSQVASGETANPSRSAVASRSCETAGSPSAPSARLASVMPSWQADR